MIKRLILILLVFIGITSFSVEPYKKYTAIVYQLGLENPVVVVLENEIGPIKWTRLSNGYYKGFLFNSFPINKTWLSITGDYNCSFLYGDPDDVIIITRRNDGIPVDGVMMVGAFIEIRIYEYE